MDTHSISKINYLIRQWPKGTVGVQRWLTSLGIDRFLAEGYCRTGWLERIGYGAYKLYQDSVDWTGAVWTLQHALNYQVHVGAQTALELQGYRQNIPMRSNTPVWLIKNSHEKRNLPKWVERNFSDAQHIHYFSSALWDENEKKPIGLTTFKVKDYKINIATPERAILEYLDLVPSDFSVEQAQFLMSILVTLKADLLETLLERCQSIKVKRLFLILAEHEKHAWLKKINIQSIGVGSSKLMIGKGGYYYPQYKLSLPVKLENHEGYDESNGF